MNPAQAEAIDQLTAALGAAGTALTASEARLIAGVIECARARQEIGDDGDLGREMIRSAAAEITGQESGAKAADELRELLAAVCEAIDIPIASCAGEDDKRQRLLTDRAQETAVILRRLGRVDADVPWSTQYLKERIGGHPVRYVTYERFQELLRRGASYSDAVNGRGGAS